VAQVVFPQFQISGIFIRDEPIVVIAASDALTDGGTRVAWSMKAFRTLAASKGFARVTSREMPNALLPGATVICGVATITLDLGAGSLDAEILVAPTEQWREALRDRQMVGVLFVRPRRGKDSSVASLTRSGRVFGGTASVLLVDSAAVGARYQFVGGQGAAPPLPHMQSVLLDASVLVDLERAAAATGNPTLWAPAHQLALQLVPMDVFPGPGLLEVLCTREEGAQGWDRAHSLIAAVNAWFDGGIARASSLDEVRAAYRQQMSEDLLDRVPVPLEAHFEQQVHYASLLKLASLWARARGGFRARQRIELFSEYVHWMANDLRLSSPLPLQIARDRLVGPQDGAASYTDQLMKLGKRPLDDLWGASWDLVHLAATAMFERGSVADIEGRAAVLVTADRGLVQLRHRIIDLPDEVDTPSGRVPLKLAQTDVDKRLQMHEDKIAQLHSVLIDSAKERVEGRALRTSPEHVSRLIAQLELDVVAALAP